MLLLASVAAIGIYAVFSLRQSAQDATRIGGRLNAIALEIQVHNLEAQRRVRSYLLEVKALGPEKAREQYLDEADFEIAAIESLVSKAVSISPTADKKEKFQRIADGVGLYKSALASTVKAAEKDSQSEETASYKVTYDKVAEQLHDNAEDGEVAGRESSQNSQEDIDRTSSRSITMAISVSLIGMLLGIVMSYRLSRAILVPVEHLKDVAENVSMGNLDISVRRYSDDEIGDLADSFSRMVTAVKFFRMEAEMIQAEADGAGDLAK
jgi:nitrogen fixation/metabolism regulation signal transduction histidine kinase